MAVWIQLTGCPIQLSPAADVTATLAEQAFPDRNGRLRAGPTCTWDNDPCPELPLPPGEGTGGVLDIYLCRNETVGG